MKAKKTLLVFTQPFIPDPASVGQHMADAAIELARRGHRVIVITSDRGYDDPAIRYPRREIIRGVEVRRVPFTSFGKTRGYLRALGALVFMVRCFAAGLLTPDLDAILFHTSPPFIGTVAAIIAKLRHVPIAYWTMDMNPDQLIALGKLSPDSLLARTLTSANDFTLRASSLVIVLDRFMRDKVLKRGNFRDRTVVIAPWPHEDALAPIPRSGNPFRLRHGLDGQTVIMYSGNHTPSNPLTTLLEAAVHYRDDPRLRFVFVGGGTGKKEVEDFTVRHALRNVLSLPYQAMNELRYSLAAADVHVVSLGEGMAGVIHPCKIYGAMSVARPILYFGPRTSHIADLMAANEIGWQVSHGDVAGAIAVIEKICRMPESELERKGLTALRVVNEGLGQRRLCNQFCDEVERRVLEASA